MKRILFVPDVHVPNHDRRAWKLLLKVAGLIDFDAAVVLGDFVDNEAVSRHAPAKVKQTRVVDELKAAHVELLDLRSKLGKAQRLVFCEGNHETRLARFIADKAPMFDGAVSVRSWLDPGSYWEWINYNESTRIGKVHVTHDVGEAGINAHRGAAKAFMSSAIIGHTHRMGYEVTGRVDGQPVLGAMFGWLGDYRRVDYQHRAKAKQWPLGFGVGVMDDRGVVHVQPVPIINYTCCVFGNIIRG